MIFRFTRLAEADLEEIGDYIAQDDPLAAADFVQSLRVACRELLGSATIYPFASGFERSGIRRRLFQQYLLFYRACEHEVRVTRILHGSRDYDRILLPH